MKAIFLSVIVFLSSCGTSIIDDRNPIGESAHYSVSKDGSRTSGYIKSGNVDIKITRSIYFENGKKGYEALFDYKVVLPVVGEQAGSFTVNIYKEFFSYSFINKLRKEKRIITDDYKIEHLGYETVILPNGKQFPKCDKLFIYDFKIEGTNPTVKDLEITLRIHEPLPALKAAQIDFKGKDVSNTLFRIGLDYLY